MGGEAVKNGDFSDSENDAIDAVVLYFQLTSNFPSWQVAFQAAKRDERRRSFDHGRQDFAPRFLRFESKPYRQTTYLVSKPTPFGTPLDVETPADEIAYRRPIEALHRFPNSISDLRCWQL
jgi:hypothetical protein